MCLLTQTTLTCRGQSARPHTFTPMKRKSRSATRLTSARGSRIRGEAVISLQVGMSTHVGMARSENQDCPGMFPADPAEPAPRGRLFVVADGMGGHRAGATASSLAVQTLSDVFYSSSAPHTVERLQEALLQANKVIYQLGTSDRAFSGMGTTCSALVIAGDAVVFGHVGDSRIYRITRKAIEQVTDDHSRVGELVRRGIITKEQARVHPERSLLYRALGARESAEVDVAEIDPLHSSCWFLLCSDGLTNHVTDPELQSLILSKPPAEAASALVEFANQRGGSDNITVIVVRATVSQP